MGTRTRRSSEAGMTLLELMIASGIMATALVLLMGSVTSIATVRSGSEERQLAASHLSTVMEELGATNVDTLMNYQPPTFRGLRGESFTVTVFDASGEGHELPLAESARDVDLPNPVRIQVDVAWQSASGHTIRRSISTFHRL